jgi:hypothetical protein
MIMTENKEVKVLFAPGCFDDFEGSQEELDALIQEITELANNGKLFEMSEPVVLDDGDIDDLSEGFDYTEEELDETYEVVGKNDYSATKRVLH